MDILLTKVSSAEFWFIISFIRLKIYEQTQQYPSSAFSPLLSCQNPFFKTFLNPLSIINPPPPLQQNLSCNPHFPNIFFNSTFILFPFFNR